MGIESINFKKPYSMIGERSYIMGTQKEALALNHQANQYALELRYSQAIIYYRQALTIYLQLAKREPEEYSLAIAHIFSNLAIVYLNLEQPKKSNELHQNALRMHRVLAKTDPQRYAIDFVRCLIDGVRYLNQHSLSLYEAEIVLNQIIHAKGAEKLVRVIRKLHSLSVVS